MTGEPTIALPTRRLLLVSAAAAMIVGGGWFGVSMLAGFALADSMAGVYGAAIAIVAMTAGLLAVGPWVARPISLWMTLWLGAMMVRFIIAIVLAWLLYSASPASPWALLAGVGGAYFAALLSEVVVLAGCMRRACET